VLSELARHEIVSLLKSLEVDSVGFPGGPENSVGGIARGMFPSDQKFVLNGLY
jgi:hypothetical protein